MCLFCGCSLFLAVMSIMSLVQLMLLRADGPVVISAFVLALLYWYTYTVSRNLYQMPYFSHRHAVDHFEGGRGLQRFLQQPIAHTSPVATGLVAGQQQPTVVSAVVVEGGAPGAGGGGYVITLGSGQPAPAPGASQGQWQGRDAVRL